MPCSVHCSFTAVYAVCLQYRLLSNCFHIQMLKNQKQIQKNMKRTKLKGLPLREGPNSWIGKHNYPHLLHHNSILRGWNGKFCQPPQIFLSGTRVDLFLFFISIPPLLHCPLMMLWCDLLWPLGQKQVIMTSWRHVESLKWTGDCLWGHFPCVQLHMTSWRHVTYF